MRTSKLFSRILVVAVAVVMVAASALASNMAFKINKDLLQGSNRNAAGTGVCTTCGNWVSLPFVNQFVNMRLNDICLLNPNFERVAQTGLASGFGLSTTVDSRFIDDVTSIRTCGVLPTIGSNPPYQPNIGINIRLRTAIGNTSQIFVGSDAPGTQQLVRKDSDLGGTGLCTTCGTWVQLPYHTTAPRLNQICQENLNFASVAQTGFCTGVGLATTPDVRFIDDVACVRGCGTTSPPPDTIGSNPPVQIGKPVLIRLKSTAPGDILWSAAHF